MNIEIYDDATLDAALAAPLSDAFRELVGRIVSDGRASQLWEHTCIILVDPTDGGDQVTSVLGFDPAIGPLGDAHGCFTPWWDWLEHHPGYFEVLHTAGTEFAYFLLVPDSGVDRSGLVALCRRFSGRSSREIVES